MPTGDLITRTYQAELNGVLMGAATSFQFGPDGIGGLGLPAVRDSDTDRPQAHGVFLGPDFMGAKPLNLPLEVLGADGATVEELLLELEAAWRVVTDTDTVSELAFRVATDRVYLAFGRPRRFAVAAGAIKSGRVVVVAQFLAADPRLYNATLETASTGPGDTTGGLSLPHGFPHGFGSSSPGLITANNAGNESTEPVALVTAGIGGIAGFSIQNITTGETFSVTINLDEAQTIEVDFKAKTVTLDGTASRIAAVDRPQSSWLTLEPGDNEIAFAITGPGTATLDLSWRSAFNL